MISTYDSFRIYEDAGIAMDALSAILDETRDGEAYSRYILEKAKKAKSCIEFIEAVAKEYCV